MAVRRPAPKTPTPTADAEAPKVQAAVATETAKPAEPASDPMNVDAAALQDNLRKAAARSIEQGRVAYDRMKEATDVATHSLEASFVASSKGAAELATKAFDAVKTNATATFDHLKALAGSKNLADAIALHGQFIRKQSEAAVAQAKEFADLAKKTAAETAAPLQEQLKKPLLPKS